MHFFHPLHVLWNHRIALFWPVWLTITACGLLVVLRFVPRRTHSPVTLAEPKESSRIAWSWRTLLALACLALFLALYGFTNFVSEDFSGPDNSMFTLVTLAGHNIPNPIWPGSGRFFPLGFQEYNLLRHITDSAAGYHVLRVFQIVMIAALLLFLDEELGIAARAALILLALITPSILISFTGLVYAESNVVFWLVCLAWSVKRFDRTGSVAWAISALICAQLLLYYKETAFLLLLGFTLGRLFYRCWKSGGTGWDFSRLRTPESRLDMCLAFLVVPFLLFYLVAMFPNYEMRYASLTRLPIADVIAAYLKVDVLVWIFALFVVLRVYRIMARKSEPSPFWDALALAGLACFAGYMVLRMHSAYYFAPVDIIAILYLGRLLFLLGKDLTTAAKFGAAMIVLLVFVQDASLSAFRLYERKNSMTANEMLAHLIQVRVEQDPGQPQHLFFPYARPYRIMEFLAYMNHSGVPVERADNTSPALPGLVAAGAKVRKDGLCVADRPLICHSGDIPEPGDLIVVLPDDPSQSGQPALYSSVNVQPIFLFHGRPEIPTFWQPLVRRMHVVSYAFFRDALPDHWPNASLSQWKQLAYPAKEAGRPSRDDRSARD